MTLLPALPVLYARVLNNRPSSDPISPIVTLLPIFVGWSSWPAFFHSIALFQTKIKTTRFDSSRHFQCLWNVDTTWQGSDDTRQIFSRPSKITVLASVLSILTKESICWPWRAQQARPLTGKINFQDKCSFKQVAACEMIPVTILPWIQSVKFTDTSAGNLQLHWCGIHVRWALIDLFDEIQLLRWWIDKLGINYRSLSNVYFWDWNWKLKPWGNLSSLIWPGGKNLLAGGVVEAPGTTGGARVVVNTLWARWPAKSPAIRNRCCWWELSKGLTKGDSGTVSS